MNEIGEYLKSERRKNGVSINEASDDLNINPSLLEAIESGNFKAFKDIYELKDLIGVYAKYLGLDVSKMLDEFNDFVFEIISKISLADIQNAKNAKVAENHISSFLLQEKIHILKFPVRHLLRSLKIIQPVL